MNLNNILCMIKKIWYSPSDKTLLSWEFGVLRWRSDAIFLERL